MGSDAATSTASIRRTVFVKNSASASGSSTTASKHMGMPVVMLTSNTPAALRMCSHTRRKFSSYSASKSSPPRNTVATCSSLRPAPIVVTSERLALASCSACAASFTHTNTPSLAASRLSTTILFPPSLPSPPHCTPASRCAAQSPCASPSVAAPP